MLQRYFWAVATMCWLIAPEVKAQNEAPRATPPAVLEQVEAGYPAEAWDKDIQGTVVLSVTVDADGHVSQATVVESVDPALDAAALAAIAQWHFAPAQQGGQAIVSRIRVPFQFEKVKAPPPKEAQPLKENKNETVVDVVVRGHKAPPPRAASDFVLDHKALIAAPHASAADLLTSAPGMYVSKPEGDAVAHEIYLRGFNCEHGQDIELSVGPVPINQPSHIHGQGYADMNFIVPEVVRSLRVTEGVYDPRQGDFAVAGSANFDLGVEKRGYQVINSYGSFNTQRHVLVWAPEGEAEETFAAVAIKRSAGFGNNRGSLSGSGMGQYAFSLSDGTQGLLHFAAYGARAGLAGLLRRDDVEKGAVDFYGHYSDPSASSQSALSTRLQAALTLERASSSGARSGFALWISSSNYRSRQNFTGYLQSSRENPEWVGRGDLIEQANQDLGIGARLFHRTPRWQAAWLTGSGELGLAFRSDTISQTQNMLQAPDNEVWDRRVDASLRASDLGVYIDTDWRLGSRVLLRGGIRADVLYYDIDDRLGNFIPSYLPVTHLQGYSRTALGVAYGPRATLEVKTLSWLDVLFSYGEGYRSPQARQLQEGENAPFAKVRALELGGRIKAFDDRLQINAAAYRTTLSSDLAFDAAEGSLETIGPSTRQGFSAAVTARPKPWAYLAASATYVHATLDAPPVATAENPTPAYKSGQLLPNVPPVVLRGDFSVSHELVSFYDRPVLGRAGLGFSYLSQRPLAYSMVSPAVPLLDASAAATYGLFTLGIEAYNLLNLQYAASEYSFVSDWGTQNVPSLVPARHFAAGAPRSILATLAVQL